MSILGITSSNYRYTIDHRLQRIVVGLPMSCITIHRCWIDDVLTSQQVQLFLRQHFRLSKQHVWAVVETAHVHARRQLHLIVCLKQALRSHLKSLQVPWSTRVIVEPSMAGLGRYLYQQFGWSHRSAWWLIIKLHKHFCMVALCGDDVCYYQVLSAESDVGMFRQQLLVIYSVMNKQNLQGVAMGLSEPVMRALQPFSVLPIQQLSIDKLSQLMAIGHTGRWRDD